MPLNVSENIKFSSFEKAGDRLVIKGEIFRAKLFPKQLKPVDKAFDLSIKLSKEDYLELKKFANAEGRRLTGLKRVELKVKDAQGKDVIDDETGEPKKVFSHYQLTLRQNKEIRNKETGEVKPWKIRVLDANNPDVEITDWLSEGSEVLVEAIAYNTTYQDKPHLAFNLGQVRVLKVVKSEGSGSGGYVDPFAAFGVPAPTKKEAPAQEPVLDLPTDDTPDLDLGDDPFDSIPF